MESAGTIDAIRVLAAVAVLAYASVLDLRTRRVGNLSWVALSLLGAILLSAQIIADEKPLEYLLILVPVALILADVFIENQLPEQAARALAIVEYASAILLTVALALAYGSAGYFRHLVAVPAMMMFIVLLYMLDAIRGGADAKALISLAVVFPFYPDLGSLPMLTSDVDLFEVFMPFAFAVLVTAAIVVALAPIGFLLRNLARREMRFPQALLGYRMEAKEARGRHVWLMERVVDGRHVIHSRPRGEEDLESELNLLERDGHNRVWVTPKIPFMIPLLIGLVFCVVVGSPLLLLFPL